MAEVYIDSKNNAMIIHNTEPTVKNEEIVELQEMIINSGYKCLVFSKDIDIKFLNSNVNNV